MKNLKGQVISFDETNYNRAEAGVQSAVSKINEIGAMYEALDSTFTFSQSVFEDIVRSGTRNVEKRYKERIDEQLKALKFTSTAIERAMKESVPAAMSALKDKVEAFLQFVGNPLITSFYHSINFDTSYLVIAEGKAELSDGALEQFKKMFSVVIETDAQSELYNHLMAVKESYEMLTAFLKRYKYPLGQLNPLINSHHMNAMMWEDGEKMNIRPEAINIRV